MVNNFLCIASVLLIFLAQQLRAQELLLTSESEIVGISVNKDGRLHILHPNKICDFEGKQFINDCFQFEEDVSFVLPISDGYYMLFYQNVMVTVVNNEVVQTDSFPDLISKAVLHQNNLFIGTAGKGLFSYKLNNNQLQFIGLAGEFINDLVLLNDDIFMALDNGVAKYNVLEEKIDRLKLPDIITHLSTLGNNIVAISIKGELFNLNEQLIVLNKKDLSRYEIKKVSSSQNRTFFTTPYGCYSLDSSFQIVKLSEGHFENILALSNNLLLTQKEKLLAFDITTEIIHTDQKIFSIYSENDSILWAGSINRIYKFLGNTMVSEFIIPSSVPKVYASALLVLGNHVFIGTMGDGLFILNKSGKLIKHIQDESENNRNNIISLTFKSNMVWIAYLNGVSTIDPFTLQSLSEYDEILENNYLYCIEPISENEFYVGTSNKGVIHYKNENLTHFLEGKSIYSLNQTKNRLYIGTESDGVFILENNSVRLFNNSLAPRSILNVGEIVLFGLKSKCQMVWDETIIPIASGSLVDGQLNARGQNDHHAFIGFANGILKVNKKRLKSLRNMALHLNQPMLFDKLVTTKRNFFDYSENSFSFSFHPTTYYQITDIKYRHRLLGLDTNWQETQQNHVSFYNLRPGKYTFEVGGTYASNSRFFNKQFYSFEIKKPFWETIWFILLISGLLIALIIVGVKKREKQLLRQSKQQQEKIRFELAQLKNQIDPHFMFNSFNSLMGQIEENPQSAIESTQLFSDLYRSILKYEKMDLIPLETELALAKNYFHMHKIRFEDLIELTIEDAGHNKFKIIPLSCQFLIENAIKHNVINSSNKLSIQMKIDAIYLVVSNTLNPFEDRKGPESGIGLKNLESRYKYFTDKALIIDITKTHYIVKLPLIYDKADTI